MGNCCGKGSKGKHQTKSNDKKPLDAQKTNNAAAAGNGHQNGHDRLGPRASDTSMIKESVVSTVKVEWKAIWIAERKVNWILILKFEPNRTYGFLRSG